MTNTKKQIVNSFTGGLSQAAQLAKRVKLVMLIENSIH